MGSKPVHIALLDYDLSDKTSKARHDGFLSGFGVKEGDPQIAGSALNMGNAETGQTAMENLLSAHPDINVLYTINEPAAQGAHFAIKKAKRDVARDFDRRKLLGRSQRRGWYDRRDGYAVPRSHGADGRRSDHQGGQ